MMSPNCIIATIDGAARGNPGPAAFGAVFQDARGKVLGQLSGRLGDTTNNVAEYGALIAALVCAREQGWRALTVRTDSELLAHQLAGNYRVRSAALKPLHEEAGKLIATFDYLTVEAVPRKLTRAADKLANAALDRRSVPLRPRLQKKSLSPAAPAAGKTCTVRAVYEAGVLKPLDKLDLYDGEEVEVIVRRKQ